MKRALALLIVLVSLAPAAQAAPVCRYLPRLTKNPTTSGSRVVLVYVVPAGATDERLDVPKACSDGSFQSSTLHRAYRDISIWMAKELATRTGTLRLATVSHAYRNPYTAETRSQPAAFFVSSPTSASTWNCWSPSTKLDRARDLLRAKGFASTNYVYGMVIQAKQTCTSQGVAGVGALNAAGGSWGYAYALRQFWAGGSNYVTARYGCSNYSADAILAHEIFHVLGGVPIGAPSSDDGGHITSDHDVMEAILDGPFATREGRTRLDLDAGTNDYRSKVLRDSWTVKGLSPSTSYRLC